MVNTKQRLQIITAICIAAAIMAVAWGAQKVSAAVKKSAQNSQSIRVSEATSCPVANSGMEEPHFSGCNSLL